MKEYKLIKKYQKDIDYYEGKVVVTYQSTTGDWKMLIFESKPGEELRGGDAVTINPDTGFAEKADKLDNKCVTGEVIDYYKWITGPCKKSHLVGTHVEYVCDECYKLRRLKE